MAEGKLPSWARGAYIQNRGKQYGMLLQAIMNGKLQRMPWIN